MKNNKVLLPKAEPAITDYPRKLFYRIQEVAEITGVKPYVLRYWETQFKELRPEKSSNSQRRYRQEDIEMVLKIKSLLYDQKFTIAGARTLLRSRNVQPEQAKTLRSSTLRGIRAELCDLMNQLSA